MDEVKIIKRIVINQGFGGFGLSERAQKIIARRKGWLLREQELPGFSKPYLLIGDSNDSVSDRIERDDPVLIEVVEELGDEANGRSATLKVVEVNVVIDLSGHDGYERISVHGGQRW